MTVTSDGELTWLGKEVCLMNARLRACEVRRRLYISRRTPAVCMLTSSYDVCRSAVKKHCIGWRSFTQRGCGVARLGKEVCLFPLNVLVAHLCMVRSVCVSMFKVGCLDSSVAN